MKEGEMVLPPEERDWTWNSLDGLGISTSLDDLPPAHVQGPFLRLLRTHEDEGLRLVHGLTNAATANSGRDASTMASIDVNP